MGLRRVIAPMAASFVEQRHQGFSPPGTPMGLIQIYSILTLSMAFKTPAGPFQIIQHCYRRFLIVSDHLACQVSNNHLESRAFSI